MPRDGVIVWRSAFPWSTYTCLAYLRFCKDFLKKKNWLTTTLDKHSLLEINPVNPGWGWRIMLAYFDLSEALDTIEHSILLHWIWELGVGWCHICPVFVAVSSGSWKRERSNLRYLQCGIFQSSLLLPLLPNISIISFTDTLSSPINML